MKKAPAFLAQIFWDSKSTVNGMKYLGALVVWLLVVFHYRQLLRKNTIILSDSVILGHKSIKASLSNVNHKP